MSRQIVRYPRNLAGRDLIVGDIHGCFGKLQVALDAIGFDPDRDRLFSVGDLVDRGPESDLVGDWLAQPWFHAIRGNHEEAAILFAQGLLPALDYLQRFGGGWNIANPQAERQRIADLFEPLPLAIELETEQGLVGIVHAECPVDDWGKLRAGLAVDDQRAAVIEECCLWARTRAERLDDSTITGVIAVVVGHTPFMRMTSLGNVLFIDTFAWRNGHFTILDAANLRPAEAPSAHKLDWS